jgi:hypothetical protein
MKRLPRLTDDALFYLAVITLTVAAVIIIGEATGLVAGFINSIQ